VNVIETAVQDGAEDALIEGQAVIGFFQVDREIVFMADSIHQPQIDQQPELLRVSGIMGSCYPGNVTH
jgi:hypothetical protein